MQLNLFEQADKNKEYELIGKSLFLIKQKILVIGDLHLGFEFMLREGGSLLPQTQIKQTIDDLNEIFNYLKNRKVKINKIVFLGDIKHFFAYKSQEKNIFLDVMKVIEKHVSRENVILLKGNHEKIDIADRTFLTHYIYEDTIFIHGDKFIPEIKDKSIKKVIMGHLHPAIRINDSQSNRSEKYKCFLIGKYKGKQFFILPSFFPLVEGSSVNDHVEKEACIVPPEKLKTFNVFIVGDKNSIYDFGKLKSLESD
ncbi:MAG: metallophosphoesterase [Candidatus Pacearchaeota archaeon]|jgi:hypothetical protein